MTDTTYHQWKHLPNDVKIKALDHYGIPYRESKQGEITACNATFLDVEFAMIYAQTLLKG